MMNVLTDALRFSCKRVQKVLDAAKVDDQDRAALIEARDTLAAALAHSLGPEAAQELLQAPDGYRELRANPPHRRPRAKGQERRDEG